MDLRHLSDGIHLDRNLFGREAPFPSWSSGTDSWPFAIQTGDNGAGNGGDGYFAGSLTDSSYAAFEPFNLAQAGSHATAIASQGNLAIMDQAATQLAGNGGGGGNVNAALGGSAILSGPVGSGSVATGDNGAGNGGDGHFSGSMSHTAVAVYDPINIAVAGYHATADAHQSNTAVFHQSAFQMAGGGGHGGNGNAAIGGNVSFGALDNSIAGSGPSGLPDWIVSYMSGNNHAGDGGDGYFHGSIVHVSFALFSPINIAIAGYNGHATADQTNNAIFDQSALQMAGIGGHGGDGNVAIGGSGYLQGLIGSDGIATGGNVGGSGGDGHFAGSLVDINVAIFAPINIAVAGPNSTADAHQTNNVLFDQHAIQLAGIGGDGGYGNAALGGDIVAHVLADPHLMVGHA